MKFSLNKVLLSIAIFLTGVLVYAGIFYFPTWQKNRAKTVETLVKSEAKSESTNYSILASENQLLVEENGRLKQQLDYYITLFEDYNIGAISIPASTARAENFANQLAIDFNIRNRLKSKIIYEDYNPVTNETRFCEQSQDAKDILRRSNSPDGVVYAMSVYDPSGYFIVFGDAILNNQTMMTEAVIHELAHVYCVANNLDQGPDEHSRYYDVYYRQMWNYAYSKLINLL